MAKATKAAGATNKSAPVKVTEVPVVEEAAEEPEVAVEEEASVEESKPRTYKRNTRKRS